MVLQCKSINFSKTSNFQRYCLKTHGSIKNLFDKAKNGDIFAQEDLGLAYCEGGDFLPKDAEGHRQGNLLVKQCCRILPFLENLGKR